MSFEGGEVAISLGAGKSTVRISTIVICATIGSLSLVQSLAEPTTGLISQPINSILKRESYQPLDIVRFSALIVAPWFIKPIFGLISDFVPLLGQRRRSYLMAANALAAAAYLLLFLQPPRSWSPLFIAMLVPSAAFAWSSVVIDALLVAWGQTHRITGPLQAVQWTATWGATILNGFVGGYLSQHHIEREAFLICGVLAMFGLLLAVFAVSEPPARTDARGLRKPACVLWSASRTRPVMLVAAFLLLWNFNPFSNTILYLYMTVNLRLSEEFYGSSQSAFAVGSLLASAAYGIYCRRVPWPLLLRASIICGCLSSLAYWLLRGRESALIVSFIAGIFNLTGMIITLDLAARTCALQAAGTLFAALMAMTNLSSSVSAWLGGWIYQQASKLVGPTPIFDLLVGLGAITTAICWLLVPALIDSVSDQPTED